MPLPHHGVEVWACNNPFDAYKYYADVLNTYTRWFNLHSRAHMDTAYPRGLAWHLGQSGERPFYTQRHWDDIPGSLAFPRTAIEQAFPEAGRFYTFTGAWLTALAIHEGFDRIEFHGFMLKDKKAREHDCYKFERPCFWYWVNTARKRGIDVWYPPEVVAIANEPGDPSTYTGPLYGYETKPELIEDLHNGI